MVDNKPNTPTCSWFHEVPDVEADDDVMSLNAEGE